MIFTQKFDRGSKFFGSACKGNVRSPLLHRHKSPLNKCQDCFCGPSLAPPSLSSTTTTLTRLICLTAAVNSRPPVTNLIQSQSQALLTAFLAISWNRIPHHQHVLLNHISQAYNLFMNISLPNDDLRLNIRCVCMWRMCFSSKAIVFLLCHDR